MTQDEPRSNGRTRVLHLDQILGLLAYGHVEMKSLLPWSSNYTFLVSISQDDLQCLAVYKPRRGETPLWDFPRGTLYLREMAAFTVSQALGWHFVPPTVLRNGPHGIGSAQLFIDADPDEHYFTLRDNHVKDFQRIALFDFIANNADRKSGHCLLGTDGRIWAVDHGITFHVHPKLRTVIWDFSGLVIPEDIMRDLEDFQRQLNRPGPLLEALSALLSSAEIEALKQRVRRVLSDGIFPHPGPRRNIPWPMV